jgi:hypothetical protein
MRLYACICVCVCVCSRYVYHLRYNRLSVSIGQAHKHTHTHTHTHLVCLSPQKNLKALGPVFFCAFVSAMRMRHTSRTAGLACISLWICVCVWACTSTASCVGNTTNCAICPVGTYSLYNYTHTPAQQQCEPFPLGCRDKSVGGLGGVAVSAFYCFTGTSTAPWGEDLSADMSPDDVMCVIDGETDATRDLSRSIAPSEWVYVGASPAAVCLSCAPGRWTSLADMPAPASDNTRTPYMWCERDCVHPAPGACDVCMGSWGIAVRGTL